MFSPTPRYRAIKLQTWLEKLNTRKILINFCLFANYWSFKSIVWYCNHLIDVTILVLSSAQNKKLLLPFTFYLLRNQINANKIYIFRANYLTKLSDQSNVYQRIYDNEVKTHERFEADCLGLRPEGCLVPKTLHTIVFQRSRSLKGYYCTEGDPDYKGFLQIQLRASGKKSHIGPHGPSRLLTLVQTNKQL